jgi:hypothetical protein
MCACPQTGRAGSKVVSWDPGEVEEVEARPHADNKHLSDGGTGQREDHQQLALQACVGTVLVTPHPHHLHHYLQTGAQIPSLL